MGQWTKKHAEVLCALIAGYDNRFRNDEPTVVAWRRAASMNGWEPEAAVAAVDRFYNQPLDGNESLPRVTPGHIGMMIRQLRPGGRGPAPASEVLAELRAPLPDEVDAPPASPELRARLREMVTFELEAKRGRPSRIQPRMPRKALEARRASVDPVSRDEARAQLRALLGPGAQGLSTAFGGRAV